MTAATATLCLDYDAHDQLGRSRSGCSNGCVSCPAGSERSWQHDDFGNVVSFTSEAMQGLTRMEWTARGEIAIRQTPMMESANAWLRYEYDGAGRAQALFQEHYQGQPERLFWQEWDKDTSGGSCGYPQNTEGRLARRIDAAGETVFSYKALGQTWVEALTDRQQRCLRTIYNWGPAGKLYSVMYPFGRTIGYEYPLFPSGGGVSPRVSAVNVYLHDGKNWLWTPLISGVSWEPFGGLRFYRVRDAAQKQWASVDYRQGNTTLDMAATCPEDVLEPPDGTGRPWKLVVQRHGEGPPPEPDTTDGEHVYVATYAYLGQYLRNERRCLLDDGDPVMVEYSTTQGTGALAGQTLRNGNGDRRPGHRQYDVSSSGERFLEVLDFSWASTGSGSAPQLWRTVRPGSASQDIEFLDPAFGPARSTVETRQYDADGRVAERIALTDSSQHPLWQQSLRPGHTASGGGGGLDSVYRTVTTAAGTYEYFYDANNRRREKVYPSGVADDFYYASSGNQLYVDVGNDDPLSPRVHPTDDYVWLGGQVVAIVRGKLNSSYDRLADDGNDCVRNGDAQFGTRCGVYYPVMDVTGRPALLLDADLKVAGVGESDPFGHVNRVQVLASTDHAPYANYYHLVNGPLLREFSIDRWADKQTEVVFKLHFYGVDTEPYNDQAAVWDVATGQPLGLATDRCQGLPECGYHLGETSTWWMQPSDFGYGPINLEFVSSARNYSPPGEPWTDKWPYWGVALDRVDYRRSEQGVQGWWPPIRLPGQYYDEETDLFENWNRYYDATTGRYLS